jgi:hypothetical protein
MRKIILKEEADGVIRKIEDKDVKCWNRVFCVPKAGGKWRKVLDCRALNEVLVQESFKMLDVKEIGRVIQEGDWATSLDIE